MNKKKFLKILEEKLQILSEEERKDILNEYKDTIEEKVRHGSSEEEAVADFGSIEELSREILKAYKINPDYSKNKDKVKDFVEDGENLIKKGAEKLSEWTQDVVEDFKNNDQNWTLEMVFEIIIKAIILLIGLSLLRIPFYLIENLGINIFEMAFPPFDTVFKVILRCLTGFIYFIACIVIAIIVFKPYFMTSKKSSKKKGSKVEKQVFDSNEKITTNDEQVVRKENGIGKWAIECLKVMLFLCTVFPLYFVDFGCYVALAVLIFLLIEGIPLIGPIFILLSLSIFFTFFTRLLYNLIYGKKRIYCYSLILSAILFATGCFLSLSTITNFEFYDGLPENTLAKQEITYQETISTEHFRISYRNYQIEEDNSLEDNKIEVVVSYYSDFVTDIKEYQTKTDDTTLFHFKINYKSVSRATRKTVYHLIMEELKELHWYHYGELGALQITVKANSNTIDKLNEK